MGQKDEISPNNNKIGPKLIMCQHLSMIVAQFYPFPNRSSKVLTLMFGSQNIPVYCHMENFGCGDGGWTPVMKIDGNKVQTYSQHS